MEHRFRVLLNIKKGLITEEEASALIGCQVRTVRQLMTLNGERLHIIVPLVDRLMQPVNTKTDQRVIKERLAKELNSTYRQVNRLLKGAGIIVPPANKVIERKVRKEGAQARVNTRLKAAIDVIAGLRSAADAAEYAQTTTRHIYRLCGTLLSSQGLVFRDLKHVKPSNLVHLVQTIERKLENV